MVIVMDETCATSEQEHLHLHTRDNESSARYIIIIIIIRCIHETPATSSYLCQSHMNWNEFQCNEASAINTYVKDFKI